MSNCLKCQNTGTIKTWNRHEGNVEFDDCDCGIVVPPFDFVAALAQDNQPKGVLAMQKDWQRQFGKAVA